MNRVRQPAAKVKKEPDTELLISPDLKKKILIKEGVDLKRINSEYQEKKLNGKGNGKGNVKEKHEPKINKKEPAEFFLKTNANVDMD